MGAETILILMMLWIAGHTIWTLAINCHLKEVEQFGHNHTHTKLANLDHDHDHQYAERGHDHDHHYITYTNLYEALEKLKTEMLIEKLKERNETK